MLHYKTSLLGNAGWGDALLPASLPVRSLGWRLGVDGQGVDTRSHLMTERMIHEAVPRRPRQAFEGGGPDMDREVPALAGTGMAGMQVAVVDHAQLARRERLPQQAVDQFSVRKGGGVYRGLGS